jgi:hypothetical protein
MPDSAMISNFTVCDVKSTNHTTKDLSAAEPFPAPIAALLVGVTAIVTLLNLCVLIVFFKSKVVRENYHYNLVVFLSISDLTLGLSGMMKSLRFLIPSLSEAIVPCIMSTGLTLAAVFMSLFQTFLISLHRFLVAVNSRWRDRLFQEKRKYIIYVFSWMSSLVWIFAFVHPTPKRDSASCSVYVIYGEHYPVFSRVFGVLGMALLISTILLYSFTLYNVRKRYMKTLAWQVENGKSARKIKLSNVSKNVQIKTAKKEHIAGNSSKEGSSKTGCSSNKNVCQNRRRRVFESLKVIGIILLLLVLLTGPSVVLVFMTVFNFEPPVISFAIAAALCFINSVLNPFIYGWKIDPLREEIKLIFRMRRQD